MNALDTMTGEENDKFMRQYKENESNNMHAENYVLLAETMQDEEALMIAKCNLEFNKKFGYSEFNLRKAAHEACNDYYYRIAALYA